MIIYTTSNVDMHVAQLDNGILRGSLLEFTAQDAERLEARGLTVTIREVSFGAFCVLCRKANDRYLKALRTRLVARKCHLESEILIRKAEEQQAQFDAGMASLQESLSIQSAKIDLLKQEIKEDEAELAAHKAVYKVFAPANNIVRWG